MWKVVQRRVNYIWNTVKYFVNPDVCADCHIAVDFPHPEYEYAPPKGISRLLTSYGEVLCGNCLAVRISQAFKYAETQVTRCECCGIVTSCMESCKHYYCDIRFGVHYWNGSSICETCLMETAQYGTPTSPFRVLVGKHWYYRNELGALIPRRGETLHWLDILSKL